MTTDWIIYVQLKWISHRFGDREFQDQCVYICGPVRSLFLHLHMVDEQTGELSSRTSLQWQCLAHLPLGAVLKTSYFQKPVSERTKTFRPQCFTHVNCATEVMGQDINKGRWAYLDNRMDVCNVFCALSLTF